MKLLADSSALLALYLADDRNHLAAIDFLRGMPRARFVLSEMILGEVATRLAARAGALRGVEVAKLCSLASATKSCSSIVSS